MKNLILVLVALFCTISSFSQENTTAEIKFVIETYDFGTIKQGDKVTYNFEFKNIGKDPLIISSANGSCGCTVPQWPKEPISKGEKGSIHVEFNSAGKMGMQDKTITIASNSKAGPVVLHLKGNVEVQAPSTDAPAKKD
jgi:hypothetical protein